MRAIVASIIAIPIVQLLNCERDLTSFSWMVFLVVVAASGLTYQYGMLYFQLFSVVIFDVRRREEMGKILRNLLRLTDLDPESREMVFSGEVRHEQLAKHNVLAVYAICETLSSQIYIPGTEIRTDDEGAGALLLSSPLLPLPFSSLSSLPILSFPLLSSLPSRALSSIAFTSLSPFDLRGG
jgi:hypothetical protein